MVKRIKKRNQKKCKLPSDDNFEKKIAKIHEERLVELDSDFKSGVDSISDIYSKYTVQNIATSLFVYSLWLPNIASGRTCVDKLL